MSRNEIVIFETENQQVKLPVNIENETVWLNRNQMAELFDRDVKTIGILLLEKLHRHLYDENV